MSPNFGHSLLLRGQAINEIKLLSSSSSIININLSLDPINWSSAQYVSPNLLDSLLNFIETVRDRPVWQPIPTDVRLRLENESYPQFDKPLSDKAAEIIKRESDEEKNVYMTSIRSVTAFGFLPK
ncbi:unnamed protein product [Rotaria sordida]|uniref:Uncharacterized protein n=1 Tax=Rotaria sordida TaxID=392033 RepID=A0A814L623_9BILA|nr:unnamed protein product [Rotaria sordida]CAF1101501.1 unnamed protein product [Rotaria sordida]CAF3760000.1 unnamed protein product [Rotaria sordida]CAF4093058.1 unnamed protein product [Rotaria sordida]